MDYVFLSHSALSFSTHTYNDSNITVISRFSNNFFIFHSIPLAEFYN